MIRKFSCLFAAALLLVIAACNTAQSNRDAASSPVSSEVSASASPSAEPSPEKPGIPVKAAHISFALPASWTVQRGEESYAFQDQGKPVGGLDGLGYSETIDGLLPNGADIDSQTELKGLPVKAVEAKLVLEGQGEDGKREELHYYFFLEDKKAVYDLRFDAKQVQEDEAWNIAKTAVVY